MASFEENRLRANKWFSLYYEAAMEWIGNNIEDVKKYSIDFPFRYEGAINGFTSIKFFITIELKNGFSTCLMAEIVVYDKKVLENLRTNIKFRYSNWNYDISNIGQEWDADICHYLEFLDKIKRGEVL